MYDRGSETAANAGSRLRAKIVPDFSWGAVAGRGVPLVAGRPLLIL